MTDELWRWSATDLSAAIRNGDVSSREAVASSLERLALLNPYLNAVVDVLADEAMAAAMRADLARKRRDALGPLHGLPVTIKVNVDQAGRATTNGVVAFKDVVATEDSPPVANWRKAGAVVIGRTNTPAFSWRWFTDNALHGRTLNPWNAAVTPGGSSGGAASALAAGIGALAHGSDLGGSIRYPAYACGVAGIRPSFGRVPAFNPSASEERPIVAQMTSTQGALARTIADLRLGLAAMSARDVRDPWWTPVPIDAVRIKAPHRVALCASHGGFDADATVTEAVRQAGRWLAEAGYEVEEAEPPRFAEAAQLWLDLLLNEAKDGMLPAIEKLGDDAIRESAASMFTFMSDLDGQGFQKALARRSTLLRLWLEFFERYPVLLMPVSWQRPFPIDLDQRGPQVARRILDAQSPLLATAILGLPGVSVPTGLVDGVPMGVQLVAGRFDEALCLDVGAIIEQCVALRTPIDPVGKT
jgi:amidase